MTTARTIEGDAPDPAADVIVDERTLALLRNDLRGLSRDAIGTLVSELTARMGVDPALAPIDLIADRSGALRVYINARGAAELRRLLAAPGARDLTRALRRPSRHPGRADVLIDDLLGLRLDEARLRARQFPLPAT